MPISCARKLSDKQFRAVEWQSPGRLTAGQVHHRAPVFSSDGRWLCLLSGDAAEAVWLVCDHKGRPSRVLAGPAAGGASFGRDLSLAYGRQVGATEEIWQLAAGARRAKRLLGGDGLLYRDPAHSPCGRYLAFAAALEDAPTRLHVLDLRSGAKVILPVPSGLEEASLGRPAWSPTLDRIFFEAVQGEEVAVYTQELAVGAGGLAEAPGRCVRLTPEGERQRRPAPLSPECLIVERDQEDGTSDLALLVFSADEAEPRVRARRLTARARCAREPAVAIRKGAAYLCCALQRRPGDDDVQRYDLYLGRLHGLPVTTLPDAPEAEDAVPVGEGGGEGAEEEGDVSTAPQQSGDED